MAVQKELFVDWKKGAVGEHFTKAVCESSDELIAVMVSRKSCDNEQDMWIRGALWALDWAATWEPELIQEEEAANE